MTLRGPELRFDADAVVAMAGAAVDARAGDRDLAMHATEPVRAGETLRFETARRGLRMYLAVRGGLAVDPVLGSASTDLLTGLGPPPLERGTRLAVGRRRSDWPEATLAPVAEHGAPVLRVVAGPRDDWFTAEALDALTGTAWTVAPSSNRIGVRLQGPRL